MSAKLPKSQIFIKRSKIRNIHAFFPEGVHTEDQPYMQFVHNTRRMLGIETASRACKISIIFEGDQGQNKRPRIFA